MKEGKPGRFQLAHGGTLFLDEIGDMPLSLQGKLLRVLQDHSFEAIGGTKTIRVDIRVIAATNQDLERKVREGSFRKDLFFRLNVITLPIPPLRERPEDILPLVHFFLRKYNSIFGISVTEISPEVLSLLQDYSGPGNVRELENIIERAMNYHGEYHPGGAPAAAAASGALALSRAARRAEGELDPWLTAAKRRPGRKAIRVYSQAGGNDKAYRLCASRSWLSSR